MNLMLLNQFLTVSRTKHIHYKIYKLKPIFLAAETAKRDQDLLIVPVPNVFPSDTTSSVTKSVIVRAPSGGTPSTSVSICILLQNY